MLSLVISRLIILLAGVIYPAYSSYKSVKEKNVKGYIKWLMYWVVYALFASVESITDMFVAWIPFYYEMKILILLWLVSPASRGSVQFYIRYLHPLLMKRENEIDAFLFQLSDLVYLTIVKVFQHIFNLLRSSVSLGHWMILEQIKAKYRLQEVRKEEKEEEGLEEIEEQLLNETKSTMSSGVGTNKPDRQVTLPPATTEVDNESDSNVVVPSTTTAITTSPPTTVAASSPAYKQSASSGSKPHTVEQRRPLASGDISHNDRPTRLSSTYSSSPSRYSSSYRSLASAGSLLPNTDPYNYRNDRSSTSRYSSSTSSRSSSYSTYTSRYSKK